MPLLIQAGDRAQIFHGRFVVGRTGTLPAADFDLDDDFASPQHAAFYPGDDGTWYVEDLGSANGTWVGGSSPDGHHIYDRQQLAKGAKVRIGHTVLTVVPT